MATSSKSWYLSILLSAVLLSMLVLIYSLPTSTDMEIFYCWEIVSIDPGVFLDLPSLWGSFPSLLISGSVSFLTMSSSSSSAFTMFSSLFLFLENL